MGTGTLATSVAILATLVAATPAWSQTQVRIGAMADMSSLYSDIGGAGSIEAVRMAVEDFEAAGKGLVVDMIVDLPTSAVSSKKPCDYYKPVATIPAERAFRPLADGGCPLVGS